MPAEFQKSMDYTLVGLRNTYCFLDDILIAIGHRMKNICIPVFQIPNTKLEMDWLGYHISQSVISPIESKTSAILVLEATKTIMKFRSFLGSVHFISKFIPNLAQISHPLRPPIDKVI